MEVPQRDGEDYIVESGAGEKRLVGGVDNVGIGASTVDSRGLVRSKENRSKIILCFSNIIL